MNYTVKYINANKILISPEKPNVIIPKDDYYLIGDNKIQKGNTLRAGLLKSEYKSNFTVYDLFYSEKANTLEAIEFPFNEANLFLPVLLGINNILASPDHQHYINFYVRADYDDFIYGLHAIMLCRYFPFGAYTSFIDSIMQSKFFLKKESSGQFDILYFRVSDTEEYEKMLQGKYSQLNSITKEKLLQFNSRSPYIKGVLGFDNDYKKQLAEFYNMNIRDFNELEKPLKNTYKCIKSK